MYLRDNKQGIPHPNYWSALGGEIEEGETPQQAFERELQEEIGCQAHGLKFMGRLDITSDDMCEDRVIYLFKGEVRNDLEEMFLTEGQKLGYFTMDEFLRLKFPDAVRTFVLAKL